MRIQSFRCIVLCTVIYSIPLGSLNGAFLSILDFLLEDGAFGFLPDGAGDLYIPIFLCFDSIVSGYDLSFDN